MTKIVVGKSDIVFKNPMPHVTSVHAYFPSLVYLGDGEYVATVVLGEAFESIDLRTYIVRSTDGGTTWEHEGELYEDPTDRIISNAARLTKTPEGDLVVFLVQHDRSDHPNEGLANPETLGFVPTELAIMRSTDKGKTWSAPKFFEAPLPGPSFELCCPITILSDGRWILPTSTWPGWNGENPSGLRMVAFESRDEGETWPTYMDIMHEADSTRYFWESKVVELNDGRLLAVAWVYDGDADCDLANHYALSNDGGATWSTPVSMEIIGQTMTPHVLDDGRILLVYRRVDIPGLWATVGHLDGEQWVREVDEPIWGATSSGLIGTTASMVDNFNVLRFGAPCIAQVDDTEVIVTFWCYEDCVSVIRTYRLRIA